MLLNQCVRNRVLTKECIFSVNNRLIRQIDECPMSEIYMCKMEDDVVAPIKPMFYKRYIDDAYLRRKKNTKDELYEKFNTYHDNIKLSIEENPTKFSYYNSAIIPKVYTRSKKSPVHCSSKIPLRYKRNAIIRKLHRTNKIASNFNNELKGIKITYKWDSQFTL